jgi:hypothetical protein
MLNIEALAAQHDRASFACDNAEFADYLRTRARRDRDAGVAATFVMVDAAARTAILGYYTLSSFSIQLGALPEDHRKRARLPRYPAVPAILIGRLARASGRGGLGQFLLLDALRRAAVMSAQVAAHAVIVDAIDAAAVRFYEHYGFMKIPGGSQTRMYLPMTAAAKLASE